MSYRVAPSNEAALSAPAEKPVNAEPAAKKAKEERGQVVTLDSFRKR